MTASTSSSGAEAPAVTPTTPDSSAGSSPAWFTRKTRGPPVWAASFSSALVFDEFAEPITTIASQRSTIAIRALWRFVVAKQRSLRPGVQAPGYFTFTASATSYQSRCDSVVWASSATGSVKPGRASTSSTLSTRLIESGATAMVPTASSCPSWPTYTMRNPLPARTFTS
ncbi:MAG: hypothetical protein FD127_1566 [Acidimicrobiaceae bacterium]|nr:MAG: hypothetical protein FD127_1566 [Acidimicrobiaceae bacterium]